MATTINSGYANSPKLTANIADHADVYGGRALVFDGVTDYLDCGKADLDTSDFTVSIWINFNNIGSYKRVVGNRLLTGIAQGFEIRTAGGSNGYEAVLDYGSAHFTASATYTSTNEWHHVCVTADRDGNMVLYINGLAESTIDISSGSSGSLNHSENLILGAGTNLSYFFNGKMCDFKLFKGIAFSESQVQELYKKPESNPSNTTEYLERWYPMIEGNPESPQSIAYDHSKKGLGSEALTTNDTLTGAISSNWGFRAGWDSNNKNSYTTLTYNDTSVFSQGALKITSAVGDGTGHLAVVLGDNNFNYNPDNKLLRIKFKYKVVQLDGNSIRIGIATGGGGFTAVGNPSAETSATDIVEFDKIMDWGSNAYFFVYGSNINTTEIHLTDVSVKEVLMGNHATTNFFGDEIITNGTFDSDTTGWTATRNATLSSESGGHSGNYLKVLTGSSDNPEAQETVTVEASKQYYFSFYHKDINSSSDTPQYAIYDVSNSAYIQNYVNVSSAISSSNWVQQTNTFTTPSGCTSVLLILRHTGTANDNSYFGFDTVSLKEVGISSSGFETAVNEPVVPQVPLMKYNQKMLFGGSSSGTSDDRVENTGDININGDFTLSFWHLQSANYGWTIILYKDSNNALYGKSNGEFQLRLGDATYVDFNFTHELNTLRHFVFTRSSGTIKLYVNGVEQSDTETHNGNFEFTKIGHTSYSLRGLIDDLSVYNCSMSTTQIQELFNDGVALDATTHSKANDHLLGYWRNDGVTTWTDRSDIQAIGFDGVSNHSILNNNSIGNALGDNYTGDLSISVWFKRTQIGISGGLVDIGFDPFDLGIFTLFINSSNELTFALVDNAWNLKEDFTDTDWNHVLAVYKADSASDTKLYLNGSSVGTATGTFPSTSDMNVNGKNTYVGLYRSVGQSFTGIIGQTAIWNKELSSIEVSEIYNLGRRNTDLTTSYSTNLLAYYLLNPTHSNPDTTGSNNILDRSGNNHHATQQNGVNFFGTNDGDVQGSPDSITIREGLNSNRDGLGFYFKNPSSNVLRLNGSNEYVSAPHTKSLVVSEQFTLECWAKLDRVTPSEDNTMISKYNEAGNTGREYAFIFPTDKRLICRVSSDGTASTLKTFRADNAISDGNLWHHYAVTFSSGTMKMYVDGSEISATASGATVTTIKQDGTANVVLGCVSTSSTPRWFFNGLIDEAKVYNRALSADEINKNYKHQKGKHKND